MIPKIQLHQSMLGMLEKCGELFRRRYGARFGLNDKEEIIPPGVALITGIATHKSIEKNLTSKIDTGELLPIQQVKEAAFAEASGLWSKNVTLQDDEVLDIPRTKGESIDMAVALSTLHATDLAPKLFPRSVERKWVIELKNYPYDLAGTIDIEEYIEDKENNSKKTIIRDTKTSAKAPAVNAADISSQLSMYALAIKVVDGEMPDAIYLDSLVKTKVPKLIIQETTRTNFQLNILMRRIEKAIEVIERGALMPCRSDDWICNPKWCGYFTTCPYGGKR